MATLELEARLDNLLSTAQAETAHIDLFAPIQEKEECPICMLPLPITINKGITFYSCCGKMICDGCIYKHIQTGKEKDKQRGDFKCPFCQQPFESTIKNQIKELKKLMKKKNPHAYMQMAIRYNSGSGVFQSDTRALEMYISAAELGHAEAFVVIATNYMKGTAVEQDISKAVEFQVVSAKKGSVAAHELLADFHRENGNIDESIRHLKVAASAGDQDSMDDLMKYYKEKSISKEELTLTLHAFQKSSNEMKSKDREDALAFRYGKFYPLFKCLIRIMT